MLAVLLLLGACRAKESGQGSASLETPASSATGATAAAAPKELAVVASCNEIKEFLLCEEYDAAYLKGVGEKTVRAQCVEDHGGEWSKERCPTKGVIGRCRVTAEGGLGQVLYYPGRAPTYDTPEEECKQHADPTLRWTA
jgi:hypothetical protein